MNLVTSSDWAKGISDWIRRAARIVPPKDRHVLLNPPVLVARFTRYALKLHKAAVPADDLGARDPEFAALMMDLFRALGRTYFRMRIEGAEHLPATGPALLVGNHNGGFVPTDSFLTAVAVVDRFGPGRALYALAHDFLFEDETLRKYALKLGMLRAGQDGAHRALQAGAFVLVYPGSDLETFRRFRDRDRIILGGRRGFIRLALREQVPIVPVVSAGTHEQFIVLSRGDRLAHLLHMHKWARTEVCPIAFALPWGIVPAFVPYVPLPAQTTVSIGEPMRWPELSPEAANDERIVSRCYFEVEARMQSMLDELSKGRRFLIGQKTGHKRHDEAAPEDRRRRPPLASHP